MKKYIILLLIFLLFFSRPLSAETENRGAEEAPVFFNQPALLYTLNSVPGPEVNKDVIKVPEEKESPLRRFEVTFFISLPFVFIVNFVVLHVFEVIKQGDPNVSVWDEHGVLLPAATMSITSAISLREAIIAMDDSEEKEARKKGNPGLFFSFSKRF